jgi:elongation factor P
LVERKWTRRRGEGPERALLKRVAPSHRALLEAPRALSHRPKTDNARHAGGFMPKIAGNEIRPGTMIEHQDALWMAVKTQAVKPGKGGAYNQVELKNIVSGTKLNERFRAGDSVETIHLDKNDFQFLYESGEALVFMDIETYDQIEIARDFVGDQAAFLQDGMKVLVQLHEGRPIGIQLPIHVVFEVVEADAVLRGGTAAPSYKSATLSNGMRVQVPPFINAGTRIVVSTGDGSYLRRAD